MGDRATKTALWLTHSTPQFPKRNQNHFWPLSGNKKGQTFLCVSLPFAELGKVGQHLRNIRAYSFDFDLPTDFPNELQNAASWFFPAAGNTELGKFQVMSTRGRVELKMMAKPTGTSVTGEQDQSRTRAGPEKQDQEHRTRRAAQRSHRRHQSLPALSSL